jgi:uncharacterized protein (TIGR02118 family)
MAKLWVLLQRKPELSVADFRAWWFKHIKLSSRMPGVQGYYINLVNEIRPFGIHRAAVDFDGTAELRFASDEDLALAFSSAIGPKAVADADRECSRRVEFLTQQQIVIPGPTRRTDRMVKVAVLLKRAPALSVEEFRSWWLDHVERSRLMPGLRGYRINFIDAVRGNGFSEAEFDYDGTAELWFDDLLSVDRAFDSEIGRETSGDASEHCQRRVRYLTEEHVVIEGG